MEATIQSSSAPSVDGHPLFGSHGSASAVGAEGYATVISVFLEDGRVFHNESRAAFMLS